MYLNHWLYLEKPVLNLVYLKNADCLKCIIAIYEIAEFLYFFITHNEHVEF